MGIPLETCSTGGCGRNGPRRIALLVATLLAVVLTVALVFASESVSRHAGHANIQLPGLTTLLFDVVLERTDFGHRGTPVRALLVFAMLLAPYFLAGLVLERHERHEPAGLAFRLVVQVTLCVLFSVLVGMLFGMPFVCL